jgi:CheY-like chemotaxis protein
VEQLRTLAISKILVVDDEAAVRDTIVEALREYGYDVTAAESAEDALNVLRDAPDIQMLISDIHMPGMSGIELAAQARVLSPGLRVLLVSGYFIPQQVSERFLRKPFRMRELASAVQAELG